MHMYLCIRLFYLTMYVSVIDPNRTMCCNIVVLSIIEDNNKIRMKLYNVMSL